MLMRIWPYLLAVTAAQAVTFVLCAKWLVVWSLQGSESQARVHSTIRYAGIGFTFLFWVLYFVPFVWGKEGLARLDRNLRVLEFWYGMAFVTAGVVYSLVFAWSHTRWGSGGKSRHEQYEEYLQWRRIVREYKDRWGYNGYQEQRRHITYIDE